MLFSCYDSNDRHTATRETVDCVMRIRAKAGMKTQLYRGSIRELENLWIQWKGIDKQKTGKDDERREEFSRKMGNLWDSSAEDGVHPIMSSILLGKKENEEDLEFY